ncbi:MAG: DUF1501 domain-containing protein [Armatimonadota bacterium]
MAQHKAWWGCDGSGHYPEPPRPTRRAMLSGTAAALAVWAGSHSALAGVTMGSATAGKDTGPPHVLVVLFLRGGADGLSLVPPYGEDAYHRLRPTIGLASPTDKKASVSARSLELDGFFGLHPSLAPLQPLFADGTLAIVHAVGSSDESLSHFEAMAAMESGLPDAASSNGWLARYLAAAPPQNPSPLRGLAFGPGLPDSLRGASNAVALESLEEFRLTPSANPMANALAMLYAGADGDPLHDDPVRRAGRETLHVLDVLRRLDPSHYKPERGAAYPQSDLGAGFRQIACLIKARVGMEAACLDHRGPYLWDTHVAQPNVFPAQAADLAQALAAFAQDMGSEGLQNVTVIAMTEFGRRVQENSGLGTDHGHGSVLFALGGPVRGGRVYGKWPGLEPHQLASPGDLRITTDYRHVLSEIIQGIHGPKFPTRSIFSGLVSPGSLGLVRAVAG